MNIIHKKNLIYANKSLTGLLGLDRIGLCIEEPPGLRVLKRAPDDVCQSIICPIPIIIVLWLNEVL